MKTQREISIMAFMLKEEERTDYNYLDADILVSCLLRKYANPWMHDIDPSKWKPLIMKKERINAMRKIAVRSVIALLKYNFKEYDSYIEKLNTWLWILGYEDVRNRVVTAASLYGYEGALLVICEAMSFSTIISILGNINNCGV